MAQHPSYWVKNLVATVIPLPTVSAPYARPKCYVKLSQLPISRQGNRPHALGSWLPLFREYAN